jgi:hypothetical protein
MMFKAVVWAVIAIDAVSSLDNITLFDERLGFA